MMHGVYGLIRC